ncbi:MAG: FxsA family protein [Rhodothermales bacterium]|nr:FxsA family protein [Rhodothermales bacterium]
MFFRLLLLFIVLPIVELALLIELGRRIGFWPTMGIVVVTGILGSTLARRQGLAVWRQFNQRLQQGQLPGTELVDGIIILLSATFLLTPGIITDVLGLIGLLPFSRALIRRGVLGYLGRRQASGALRFHVDIQGAAFRRPPEPPSAPDVLEWQGTPRERPSSTE